MLSAAELENIVEHVIKQQDAGGVLLLILTKNERAEMVAALRQDYSPPEETRDVPTLLRRLADEVESGGGVPVGRHLQTIEGGA